MQGSRFGGRIIHNVIFYLAQETGREKERERQNRVKEREIKRQILSALDTDKAAEHLLEVIERECL